MFCMIFQSGFTPLHISAHYGNTNVGSLLLEKGADPNFKARVSWAILSQLGNIIKVMLV